MKVALVPFFICHSSLTRLVSWPIADGTGITHTATQSEQL